MIIVPHFLVVLLPQSRVFDYHYTLFDTFDTSIRVVDDSYTLLATHDASQVPFLMTVTHFCLVLIPQRRVFEDDYTLLSTFDTCQPRTRT